LIDEPKTPYAYSLTSEEESETSVTSLSSNVSNHNFFHAFPDQQPPSQQHQHSFTSEPLVSASDGDANDSEMSEMEEEEEGGGEHISHVSFDEGESSVVEMEGDELQKDKEVIDVHDADQYTPSSDFVHKRKEHYSMKEAMKLARRLLSNEEGATTS
jgi:hypothetical protein